MRTRFGKHPQLTPGVAWIGATIDAHGRKVGGSQKLIVDVRHITRGENVGRCEVTEPEYTRECLGRWRDGKKSIVDRRSIIIMPHDHKGG